MLTLQSPSRLRASLSAAPQPSSRRSSRQHSLSPVDRRLSRQQSSSPSERRFSRQPSLSPSRRSTCRQHTQPRGFSKHSPHSPPSRRSPSPPKGRLVMECRRGAVSMHGSKAAWNARKAGAGPAVAANFNIIVDLVQKGEALKLRSLLNSAPTLRSSLKGSSEPALHVAMGCRQSACAEVLLEMDANVNATSESGRTALHIAADNDFLAGMEILVRRRIKLDVQDGNGQTAALLAAGSHHPDAKKMFMLLIEAGADAALVDKTRSNVAHYASAANNVEILANMHSMHPAATRSSDSEGCNPLHYASGAGAERTVEWLLDEAPELFMRKDASGTLPIVRAAQNERHGAVELMMRKGFWQPDDRIVDGLTLLMIAAQEADEELVRQLMDAGASHAAACDKGRTALMHAAVTDDAGCIQALLQAGADAAAVDHEGYTALMYAACSCSAAAVAALLRMAGAEAAALLAKDRRGRTCLMQLMLLPSGGGLGGAAPRAAASPGRKKEQALEGAPHFRDSRAHERISAPAHAGRAGPRGQIPSRASSRRCVTTATSKARLLDTRHVPRERAKQQHKPSVDLLKFSEDLSVEGQLLEQSSEAMPQLGAERWCKQSDVAKICSLLLHEGGAAWGRRLLVESAIPHGNGPLEFAVGRRDELLLETLLSAQGEGELLLQHPDFQHRAASALRLAAIMGEHKMLAHLLLAGASVDARPESLDSPAHEGCTALLLAAELGHVECLQLLLDARADTTLVDSREEDCALTLAAKCEQYECLATLLKYGADPEAADCEGLTALMSCAVHGASKSISLLLSAGASANRFNNHCTSALWYGACEGKEETVKLLLSSMEPGAQILNMRAASGHTPLSIAASSNYANVCSQLLEAHAELDSVSADGTTPLYHAAAGGHLETAKILIDQRADPRRKNIAGDSILDLAIQSQNEGMAALLIHAGAAFESLAATVRKCVGKSRTDPPLVNALKLLLFGDMEEPQSSWSDSESETLDSSLLLLSSKTVLLAAERVRRTFGSETVPEDVCIGAEEAETRDDPQCEWVSAAAHATPEAGGPGRWWDVLAEEDQPVSWWYMLHGTLMLLELPRQQAAAGDIKVEYRMRKLDVHKDDEALARAALNASIREHLIEQVAAATDALDEASQFLSTMKAHRWSPFVTEESQDWSSRHTPQSYRQLRVQTTSTKHVLRNLALRLRLQAAFAPSVKEKNDAQLNFASLRRELHRTFLKHMEALAYLESTDAMGDTRQSTPTGRCTDAGMAARTNARLSLSAADDDLAKHHLLLSSHSSKSGSHRSAPASRRQSSGAGQNTLPRLGTAPRPAEAGRRSLREFTSAPGPEVDFDARQTAPQRLLPLPDRPPVEDGESERFVQICSELDAGHVIGYGDMHYLRKMVVRQPGLVLSCSIRQALLFPPLVQDETRHHILKVIDEAKTADAVEFSLESAAGVSQTLRCFVRTCIEHSSVVQCIGWIAQAEGVHACAADESGWLATHHLCDPARPELLCYYLRQTDPISIPAVINTENLEFKSAVGLLVRGSSPSQQRCLSQLLQYGASLESSQGTYLHDAIYHNQLAQLVQLLEVSQARSLAKVAVGHIFASAQTRLYHLAGGTVDASLHVQIPREFVRHGFGGRTALSLAITQGRLTCTTAILRYGAPYVYQLLITRDFDGATPLHHAVEKEDAQTVAVLLNAAPGLLRRELLTISRTVDATDNTQPEVFLDTVKYAGDLDQQWDDLSKSNSSALSLMFHRGTTRDDSPSRVSETSPIAVAAGLVNGSILEVIMRYVPELWQQEREFELLQLLVHKAMETPSESCVALLMGNCLPLQRRLLPLMLQCVTSRRESLLPIICRHARIDTEGLDENGNTVLHSLLEMSKGGSDGNDDGAMLLRSLLTTRPHLHLFAPDRRGLTALAAANENNAHGCWSVLLAATQRALSKAVISIVYCRRERHEYDAAAQELKEVLESTFRGLTVRIQPLCGMQPGEEGCPGSFEMLWEAVEWKHSRLLHSRLATGKMPKATSREFHPIVEAVFRLILGPAMPISKYHEWDNLINKDPLFVTLASGPDVTGKRQTITATSEDEDITMPDHKDGITPQDGQIHCWSPISRARPKTVHCESVHHLSEALYRPKTVQPRPSSHASLHRPRQCGSSGLGMQQSNTLRGIKPPSFQRPWSSAASLPELLSLGGPIRSPTGKSFMCNQLFTPEALLTPLRKKRLPTIGAPGSQLPDVWISSPLHSHKGSD